MPRLSTACADHFRVISDDVSLPLVTFSLKKKEGRTYSECVFYHLSMQLIHMLACTHACPLQLYCPNVKAIKFPLSSSVVIISNN